MTNLLFIIFSFVFGSCTTKEPACIFFSKLNQDIQDTLMSINQKVLNGAYLPNSLIAFSGDCLLKISEIGPWTYSKRVLNTKNMNSIKLHPNTPEPYIVYDDYLYYPDEYNLFVMGFSATTVFKKIPFK